MQTFTKFYGKLAHLGTISDFSTSLRFLFYELISRFQILISVISLRFHRVSDPSRHLLFYLGRTSTVAPPPISAVPLQLGFSLPHLTMVVTDTRSFLIKAQIYNYACASSNKLITSYCIYVNCLSLLQLLSEIPHHQNHLIHTKLSW